MLCDNLEGLDGVGGAREFQRGSSENSGFPLWGARVQYLLGDLRSCMLCPGPKSEQVTKRYLYMTAIMLPSPSSFCSLQDTPTNQEMRCWGKEQWLYWECQKLAD